jgi:uncharacterized protein YndB with AHSA1/START domain
MADLVPITHFPSKSPKSPWWIRRREVIAAPPERVWQALTDPRELASWWADDVEVDLRPGGLLAFAGPSVYGGAETLRGRLARDFEVLAVDSPERLELRWKLHGVDTQVAFELARELEMTAITVVQTASSPPGWDPGHEGPSWWSIAMAALRSRVEKGRPDLRLDYPALRRAPGLEITVGFSTFPWVIWHKLTAPSELARWWPNMAAVVSGAVLESEPERRFVHSWTWPGETTTTVSWTLAETEMDDVLVTVSDMRPPAPGAARDPAIVYWASTLLDLKHMSERGIASREYQDG